MVVSSDTIIQNDKKILSNVSNKIEANKFSDKEQISEDIKQVCADMSHAHARQVGYDFIDSINMTEHAKQLFFQWTQNNLLNLKKAINNSIVIYTNRLRRWNTGKPRHCHNLSTYRNNETSSRGQSNFTYRHREPRRSTSLSGVRGKAILSFRHTYR